MKKYGLILLPAGLLVLLFYYFYSADVPGEIGKFREAVTRGDYRLNQSLDVICKDARWKRLKGDQLFPGLPEIFQSKTAKASDIRAEEINFLTYVNDSLRFWTDHGIPVPVVFDSALLCSPVIRLKNGWYRMMEKNMDLNDRLSVHVVGYYKIRDEYLYQNKYLRNGFTGAFDLPPEFTLSQTQEKGSVPVIASGGQHLFYLCPPAGSYRSSASELYILFFSLLAGALAILFLAALNRDLHTGKNKVFWLSFFIASFLLLRFLMIYNRFPSFLYNLPVFSPEAYASSFLNPSLGDFLLNSMVMFFLSVFFYRHAGNLSVRGKAGKKIFTVIALLFLFAYAWCINYLLSGMVINSNLPFGIYNLFTVSSGTVLALTAICLWFLSFFMLCDRLLNVNAEHSALQQSFYMLLASSSVFFIIVSLLAGITGWLYIGWPIIFLLAFHVYRTTILRNYFAGLVVFLIALVSFAVIYTIVHSSHSRDRQYREVLAANLIREQDPVAEYIFTNTGKKMSADTFLISKIHDTVQDVNQLSAHISDRYFQGYLGRYTFLLTVCRKNDSLIINTENVTASCYEYFENLKRTIGKPTASRDLFHLSNNTGRISYLATIPFISAGKTLFIEMRSRINHNLVGYPELLINEKMDMMKGLSGYEYAKYRNNRLLAGSPSFPYKAGNEFSGNTVSGFTEKIMDGFNHLVYRHDDETVIVVSRKEETFFEFFIAFTYIFCFFLLIFMLTAPFWRGFEINLSHFRSFRGRIQFSVISVLMLSLLPVGIIAYKYFNKLHTQTVDHTLRDKTQSLMVELEHKFSGYDRFSPSMREYITSILVKFSNVFYTDISMYDPHGTLIASSRDELFMAGLTGPVIDPVAYYEMAVNHASRFTQKERIGGFTYLSDYRPFFNYRNELTAFVNVPWFSRQEEIQEEISTFIAALLNVYILLVLVSLLVAVAVSNRLTLPMRLIGEKISRVRLGSPGEPIQWKSRDELGRLVEQYNRMIAQLEENARQLARSERESAWRDMAKQVAHEIKNPLTPMRLHIQQLERILKENTPPDPAHLDKITSTLIQQIDALASIAGAFSDFARMPEPRKQPVDLTATVSDAVLLFRNQPGIRFIQHYSPDTRIVIADRDQLLRVFNNILKNAVQSIPETRQGVIEIDIKGGNGHWVASVRDNGEGILYTHREKIFTPDFTTKSGGTGLGLTMAKKIMEMTGGTIWFESEEGTGSTFFVKLTSHNQP